MSKKIYFRERESGECLDKCHLYKDKMIGSHYCTDLCRKAGGWGGPEKYIICNALEEENMLENIEKFWIVVDVCSENRSAHFNKIDDAKKQAEELATKHPGELFHVMELVGSCQNVTVQWRMQNDKD